MFRGSDRKARIDQTRPRREFVRHNGPKVHVAPVVATRELEKVHLSAADWLPLRVDARPARERLVVLRPFRRGIDQFADSWGSLVAQGAGMFFAKAVMMVRTSLPLVREPWRPVWSETHALP